MGPSRPSIFLPLFLSVIVCMSASLGSSSSDLVESELSKVPISEFANSVWSTIDVVQQVATLVSTFAEFANSVRLTIEVVPQVASLLSRFAEFANSVRLTIEVVQQVASLVSRFAQFAISVRLAIAVVQKVASLVSRFAGAFRDFCLSKAIADCLDLLDPSVAAAVCFVLYKNRLASTNNHSNNGTSNGKGNSPPSHSTKEGGVSQSQKAIKMICAPTDYKQACESSLLKAVGSNSSATPKPKDLLKAAISVAALELNKAKNQTATFKFETPEQQGAFEDCMVLLDDATEELNSSISDINNQNLGKLSSATPDLNNWLSAVMSYQQTCIDGFPEGEMKTAMQKALKTTREHTSNALAIITQVGSVFSNFLHSPTTGSSNRHLLTTSSTTASLDEDGLPSWMTHEDRRVLKVKAADKFTPNVTVAKDGSGNFSTITAALAAMPKKYQGRYIIYVKAGIYEEYITVTKEMVNVTMYGEGSQKSIVTGNKNFIDGTRTFQTATFAAIGEGFMAQSIGFRNTAGPEKHQAVALRVQSDHSIFVNCRMEGYQDTLYVQTHRQFYRSCLITGTIDFIFGDASAVLQNCMIYVRKPMDNQQNIVTAQGRICKHETTGIVLQNCKILADDKLEPEKAKFKSYLGRPWKEYSRTIVMESEIGDLIHPEGWLRWDDKEATLKTLYYAEYKNKGPGASVTARVKWPGYKVITNKEDATKFTVGPFIQGDTWLKSDNVPVRFGLF